MTGRLATNVSVNGVWYGPDYGEPPAEVADTLGAHLWAGGQAPAGATSEPKPAAKIGVVAVPDPVEPPRAGPGSSKAAWAAYATARGVEFDPDSTRDDIMAAIDLADEQSQ